MMSDRIFEVVWQCWSVLGEMAPYLLLGFLIAGVLSVAVSPRWVERHLGRESIGSVVKAALVGVPLPLCSCGVIPVAASIRRHGASRAATASFLLSTPQTGVDSIAATYAVLGPLMAVFRPVVAFISGILGGMLVHWFGERDGAAADGTRSVPAALGGANETAAENGQTNDRRNVVIRALEYGFVTLPRDIGNTLLLGVVIAGLIAAFVPTGSLAPYLGGGFVAMLLMIAVGIPMYVCATGSVPIAAGLIHLGASPGAAFAFLVAGPATNAATVATIWKVLGRRTALIYMTTIALVALGGGLVLDEIYQRLDLVPPHMGGHDHAAMAGGWLSHAWAVALLLVLGFAYLEPRFRTWRRAVAPPEEIAMQRVELTITGMNCSHCVASVTRALEELPGVQRAEVTLSPGRAVLTGEHIDAVRAKQAVDELGYQAVVSDAID